MLRVERLSIAWFLIKNGTSSTILKYLFRQNFRKLNLLMKNYGVHLKITEYIINFKDATWLCITNSYDLNILRGLRGSDLSHQSTFLSTPAFSLEDWRKILFMFSCFISQTTGKLKIITHIQPPQTKGSCYSNPMGGQSMQLKPV